MVILVFSLYFVVQKIKLLFISYSLFKPKIFPHMAVVSFMYCSFMFHLILNAILLQVLRSAIKFRKSLYYFDVFRCIRRPGEDSDGEYYRDSSSDGSSDCELEGGLKHTREQRNRIGASEAALRMDRLSLRETNVASQEGFSSDDGEVGNSQGCLLFEFLEQDLPYSREPLANKASSL